MQSPGKQTIQVRIPVQITQGPNFFHMCIYYLRSSFPDFNEDLYVRNETLFVCERKCEIFTSRLSRGLLHMFARKLLYAKSDSKCITCKKDREKKEKKKKKAKSEKRRRKVDIPHHNLVDKASYTFDVCS